MMIETGLGEVLLKIGMFALVQALVYFILTKSSSIFSKNVPPRSFSFKPARSVSIRRFMAALSDLPAGGEPSPSSRGSQPQLSTKFEEENSAAGDDNYKQS